MLLPVSRKWRKCHSRAQSTTLVGVTKEEHIPFFSALVFKPDHAIATNTLELEETIWTWSPCVNCLLSHQINQVAALGWSRGQGYWCDRKHVFYLTIVLITSTSITFKLTSVYGLIQANPKNDVFNALIMGKSPTSSKWHCHRIL